MSESQRLLTLSSYRILDSQPEQPFDDLVQLASRICETPMAGIGIMTTKRYWFKSKVGFDISEVPREITVCDNVVTSAKPLIVNDLSSDPRFAHNPFVCDEPKVRFYAGHPLFSSDGQVLGVFCVMDYRPRKLDEQQIRALETLTRQTTMQLELRRLQILLSEEFPDASNILSAVGHELRNPLHGLMGSLEMLADTPLTKEQGEYVQVAQRSSENLFRTVTQILAIGHEADLGAQKSALHTRKA